MGHSAVSFKHFCIAGVCSLAMNSPCHLKACHFLLWLQSSKVLSPNNQTFSGQESLMHCTCNTCKLRKLETEFENTFVAFRKCGANTQRNQMQKYTANTHNTTTRRAHDQTSICDELGMRTCRTSMSKLCSAPVCCGNTYVVYFKYLQYLNSALVLSN